MKSYEKKNIKRLLPVCPMQKSETKKKAKYI